MRLADRIRHLSLRSRVTLLFLMTGLIAAVLLSGASYITARTYLLQRRDEIVERQSFNNAQLIRTQLRTRRSEAFELISGIRTESNGFAILHLSPEDLYFSQDIRNTQTLLPTELVAATLQGITSRTAVLNRRRTLYRRRSFHKRNQCPVFRSLSPHR